MPPMPPLPADALAKRLAWKDIDHGYLNKIIRLARDEDLSGAGFADPPPVPTDITTATFPPTSKIALADLFAREEQTLCGLSLTPIILGAYGGGTFTTNFQDGQTVSTGTKIGTIEGNPAHLLSAERVLLNFLQHLSGIATTTAAFVKKLDDRQTRILDTRKTTPGYRALEKYAVICGGGWNHRLGLYDRVLIKDNHLDAFSVQNGDDLRNTVRLAREKNPGIPIEVEVDHPDQVSPVLEAGADCLLLDNFSIQKIRKVVEFVNGQTCIEASGGITLKTVSNYAGLGLDFISTGALVHQSRWVDIGLDWETPTT
jgi:nicotinate-nucleotide pyrophosphorylase (carboxylating)